MDWTVLDQPGVRDVLGKVARKVSDDYEHVEYEDALQDGAILLASRADLQEVLDNLGLLHHRLWGDLVNMNETEANRRTKLESYDVLMELCE